MDSEPIFNIIFDEPFLREREVTSENGPSPEEILNRALNLKRFKSLAQLYIGSLMGQYILVFVSAPFEFIENRPPVCVFTSFYSIFIFAINVTIFPLSFASIPTLTALRCWIIASVLEFIGLLFNIISVTLCLCSQPMISSSQENDLSPTTTNVSLYIQSVSVVSLVVCSCAFSLSVAILIISNRSLNNLINNTDRVKFQNLGELQTQLPQHLLEESKYFFSIN